MIAIIFILELDEFSGLMPLPLSRFVLYSLSMSYNIPVFVQILILSAIFFGIIRLLSLNFFSKSDFAVFGLDQLQLLGGNSIDYQAGQLTTKKNVKPGSTVELTVKDNSDKEQGILLITSGIIMFANKKFFKITGYQPSDILGVDFASLIQPDSLIHYTMLCRMTPVEINQSKGIGIITKNNKKVYAYFSGNKNASFIQDGLNIFNLKQADGDKKQESSLFFESIENVDSIQWIWDEKGIIYLNNKCREIIPFPLGKIISKPGLLLKLVRKPDRIKIRSAYKDFLSTGKFKQEVSLVLPDNSERFYRITITSSTTQHPICPMRYHAIAYDISDEKRLVQHAEAAAVSAEIANNNKTAFLANMSHEIRSPLNGIIGFSELLADKNLTDAERERYLNIIQNNGNVLITLLSDLIEISKLESGKLIIDNRKFNPSQLLDELKYQFGSSSSGRSENVKVIFNKNSNLQDLEIESDQNRLRQVLVNLITNAIKFTSRGTIEIGTDFSGNDMLFWVKDSGIGIPYENQHLIFERFRQVESKISPSLSNSPSPVLGFGLGLAISKALVELLGGKLWVESIQEKGSLFTFTIKTNITNNTMKTEQVNDSSYPYDFRERTILIAEDIDFSFLYIEAVLRRTGVKILWAQNGEEAIKHVKANDSIDLILMDMHMPVMNGYDATEVIKSFRPDITILAQTAFVLPDDVKKCFAAGCSGFLAKPIRKEQLLNTLTEYFDKIDQKSEGKPRYQVGIG